MLLQTDWNGSKRGRDGDGRDRSTTLFSHHHHGRGGRRSELAARLGFLIEPWLRSLKHHVLCILHLASCMLYLAEYCIATDAQMQFHHPTWRHEDQVPSSSRHRKAPKRHLRVARPRALIAPSACTAVGSQLPHSLAPLIVQPLVHEHVNGPSHPCRGVWPRGFIWRERGGGGRIPSRRAVALQDNL